MIVLWSYHLWGVGKWRKSRREREEGGGGVEVGEMEGGKRGQRDEERSNRHIINYAYVTAPTALKTRE